MASPLIALRAQAKKAGIAASDFSGLGVDALKTLIAERKNGGGTKGAAKTAVKGAVVKGAAVKGSTARKGSAAKTAPAKSTPRKPARKGSAVKGAQAKRPSSARTSPVRKPAVRKPAAKKAPVRKPAAKAAPTRKPAGRKAANTAGRNMIDNAAIDWTAEWNGGQTGNRQTIIKALRRFKGNTDKVFNHLVGQALSMYPKNMLTNSRRTKVEAEKQLRWAISRVKLDFVTATGQHESSDNRANYGESDNEGAVERRKQTLKTRRALGIKAPPRGRIPDAQLPGSTAARKGATVKSRPATRKPASKPATRQKPVQKRTVAKPAGRKPVVKRGGRK